MMPSTNIEELGQLSTEASNAVANTIHSLTTTELCKAFNQEEASVPHGVACCLPAIASLIDDLVPRLRAGGRLVYVGAGNSGRIGFMDCSELPVTFSADPKQFIAIVAGGEQALINAKEDAEDLESDGATRLEGLRLTTKDTVIGISASGRTPFVIGALKSALKNEALTAGITNVYPSAISQLAIKHNISILVGPEFLAGSTRLKSGSAAKQILNMISTCAMIKLGKTYRGLMIDVRVNNTKLRARGRRIIRQVCEKVSIQTPGYRNVQLLEIVNTPAAESNNALDILIQKCGGSVKLACAVAISGLSIDGALKRLDMVDGDFNLFVQNFTERNIEPYMDIRDDTDYFLSIDGGGTSCKVSIATSSLVIAHAAAGACNFSCITLERLLEQIKLATSRALAGVPNIMHRAGSKTHKFKRVWAGVAGLFYAHELKTLASRLEELYGVSLLDGTLRLTSDGSLLSSCIGIDDTVDGGISVIAGTGSVATAFRKSADGEVIEVGRTGGWGHLIGDESSGFDIGKRALQIILARMDEAQDVENTTLTELETAILAKLNCARGDLVTRILYSDNQPKSQIASLAQVVTRLGFRKGSPDLQALEILRSSADCLVRLIVPLSKKNLCDPGRSSLVFSGALMNIPEYRALVLEGLIRDNVAPFKNVMVVDDASGCAARFLARETGVLKNS